MTNINEKPTLSFWQIWNMNFGFLGIQFGFALQNANVSRIFETLGANIDEIALLWIAAPTTGLLVQPIIGYYSDRTWHPRWGRRRPFFALGAILASLALIIMPHSSVLWMAAGMLWILDASINISMEPFRAFVGDMLPQKQQTVGFATQTFFIGVGSVTASVLPYIFTNWLGMDNTAPKGQIPNTVIWSFYLGGLAFFLAVLYTILTTKEYSPDEMRKFNQGEVHQEGGSLKDIFDDLLKMPAVMKQLAFVQFFSWLALFAMWIYTTSAVTSTVYPTKIDKSTFEKLKVYLNEAQNEETDKDKKEKKDKEIKEVKEKLEQIEKKFATHTKVSISSNITGFALEGNILKEKEIAKTLSEIIQNNQNIEPKIKESLEKEIKKEAPNINADILNSLLSEDKLAKLTLDKDKKEKLLVIKELKSIRKEFNNGGDWVGVMFAAYNGFAAFFAFFFPPFARMTSRKIAHMVGLSLGGLGLISIYFAPNPEFLIISMVGVGAAWASILSMPYAILAGALPPQKMGVYMGIFNFFITIPQIVAAAVLGFVLKYMFNEEAIYAMIVGGFSMFIAALLVLLVQDRAEK